MRIVGISCLTIFAACASMAQQQPALERSGTETTALSASANLPIEKIGSFDLLGISVYDVPGLTGTVRVNSDGDIRFPMLKQHIHAAGLYPEGLENTIAAALNEGNVLVDPIVTVSVVEYRSRPIIVAGAVRNPTTFQAEGQIMLLDAILRAGGIADNAGSEILITHSVTIAGNESAAVTQRVLVRSLLDVNDPDANLKLQAGDIVRVPLAGQVYVVGDVNKPGAFYITGGSDSSVLKVLALSGGLSPFSSHTAYIYRIESGHTERSEIPIKLKKIMDRKSPDATLMANDILYIPDASGRRIGAKALETSLGLSVSAANLAMYATH